MTNKEKKYLDYIDERVSHCLKRGIDKKQIAEWIDDVIYDLSEDTSSELFNTLYRYKIIYYLVMNFKEIEKYESL